MLVFWNCISCFIFSIVSHFLKVGSWDSKDGLEISDIIWPGNSPAPPKGRPDKFHLNIATLDEDPFVIMKIPGRLTAIIFQIRN